MLLPTPEAKLSDSGPDYARANRSGSGGDDLTTTVFRHLLPTPQVADVTGGHKTRSGKRSNELLLPGVAEALTLLPTPAAHDSGNTPEEHLRKKPGRTVVTSLQVIVDHDLIRTGGRIVPPSSAGNGAWGVVRRIRRDRMARMARTGSTPPSSNG